MKALLEESSDITRLCFAAAGVAGGLRALKELQLERKIKVITYDLTDIVRENIEKGLISATVCQERSGRATMAWRLWESICCTGRSRKKV